MSRHNMVRNLRSAPLSNAAENPRSQEELDAREALMRQEFRRQEDAWKKGVPLEAVLSKLKAKISRKK